jgi:hypothetical protein
MSRPPKRFEPGAPVASIEELVFYATRGGWFFTPYSLRPKHGQVILNTPLTILLAGIRRGSLRHALERQEWWQWRASE